MSVDYELVYGADEATVKKYYGVRAERMTDGSIALFAGLFPTEPEMYVSQILSDAQHVLENGDSEGARKLMNCAKWVLGEAMRMKRQFEREM